MADEQLEDRLHGLVDHGNALTAELLAHMAEVDRRRLYLMRAAYSSMFDYCIRALKMSEGQAYKRIRAARLARDFPAVLPMVHSGQIHLCALGLLAGHMNEDNGEELLQQAAHKTRRQVEKLVACRFPSPPAPDKVHKLPRPRAKQGDGSDTSAAEPLLSCALAQPAAELAPPATPSAKSSPSSENSPVEPPPSVALAMQAPALAPTTGGAGRAATPRRKGRSTPLSADAYKIEFTAGEPLHDKLRQAQELLRHRVPNGDLATVFERALDVLLPKLRKERFAEVSRPRKPSSTPRKESTSKDGRPQDARKDDTRDGADSSNVKEASSGQREVKRAVKRSRHIPAAVKREVAERDGHQCTYTDVTGRRCPERGLVEFHHLQPFGKALLRRQENRHGQLLGQQQIWQGCTSNPVICTSQRAGRAGSCFVASRVVALV